MHCPTHKQTRTFVSLKRTQVRRKSIIMAESYNSLARTLVDTSKYYCPFQERGFCREPSRCNFSHDCQISTKVPTDYCHFYLANQCLYGQECKFLHQEPDDVSALPSNILDPSRLGDASNIGQEVAFVAGNHYANDVLTWEEEAILIGLHKGWNGDYDGGQPSEVQEASQTGEVSSEEGFIDKNCNNVDHNSDSSRSRSIADDENDQPSSSLSKLRVTKISRRCAMATPSTSLTMQAKLQPNAIPTAQTSSSTSESSLSNDTKTPKSSWQGARLIASIRNNFGEQSSSGCSSSGSASNSNYHKDLPLCPYSLACGECPLPEGRCSYLHGDVCDLCYSACLHPYDEEQRHHHREECLREHEREMELSFAVQRSKDKVCGVCMDTVVEKKPITSSRFGILEKCNHIFCLDCIRKWRGSKQFDSRTIRSCPECRVSSDFVVPSKYWVEDQDDKEKLINDYKAALR